MFNGKQLICRGCGKMYSKAWMLIDSLCPSCRIEEIDKGKRKPNIQSTTIHYVHLRAKCLDDGQSLTFCNRTLFDRCSSTEQREVTCHDCIKRYEKKIPPLKKTTQDFEVEPPL